MPRFPFRRSVGEDLRALFTHDRLQVQANDLGHSSLSPGQGSFDILDANGVEVARYGHHAGKAGFLVPDGAGWQTVGEAIAAGNAELGERLDAHAQRIGASENDITTLTGRADSHASRIGAAEGDITTLAGRADSHASRIGAAEGRLDSHAQRIGAVENDVNGIQDGTKPLQSPTMIAPKFTGLSSGGQTSEWVGLLINRNTGQLRMYGDGPLG